VGEQYQFTVSKLALYQDESTSCFL